MPRIAAMMILLFGASACSAGDQYCYDVECEDDSRAFVQAFGLPIEGGHGISADRFPDQGAHLLGLSRDARVCLSYGVVGLDGRTAEVSDEHRRRFGNPDHYTVSVLNAVHQTPPTTYRIHHKNYLFRLSPEMQRLLNAGECLAGERLVLVPSEISETGALLTVRILEH